MSKECLDDVKVLVDHKLVEQCEGGSESEGRHELASSDRQCREMVAFTHLLIEPNFAVQVLLGYLCEVFDLLRVVDLHLSHGRVQNRLATRRDLVIGLSEHVSIRSRTATVADLHSQSA